jgi:hypothetical protein
LSIISNPSTAISALFPALTSLFLRPLTHRRLLRVLGYLQWLSRPASEVAIFLAPLYRIVQRRTPFCSVSV